MKNIRRIKYTIKDCQNIAKSKGGKYLSSEYLGYNVKAKWECKNGHQWFQSFHIIAKKGGNKGTWCPYCTRTHPKGYTIEYFQKYANIHNGKCLTIEYNGRKSRLQFQCNVCQFIWETSPTSILCSESWCPKCANNLRTERRKCKNCGKECNRPEKYYCNINCKLEYEQKEYIKKWKAKEINGNQNNEIVSGHIKRYLIERSKNKCEKCGWHEINPYTKKVPLTIHHKDGNAANSYEENLEYICPNCHALTENYGILNKGNGRKIRQMRREKMDDK